MHTTYSPVSPTYSPTSPTYSPTSPTYSPTSPTYSPRYSLALPAAMADTDSVTTMAPGDSPEVTPEASSTTPAPEMVKPCKIRYKVECEDTYGPSFECEQLDSPFDLKVTEKNVIQQKGPAPVIEIITQLDVATKLPKFRWGGMGGMGGGFGRAWSTIGDRGMGRGKDDDTRSAFQGSMFDGRFGDGFPGMFPAGYAASDSSSDAETDDGNGGKKKKEKPVKKPTLENKRINKIKGTRMVVHSPWLLSVIREVVKVYPSQNLTGDTVTIHEPYHVLAHHITELRDFQNRLALEKGTTEDEIDEAATKWEHLKVLLDYLEPHIERTVLPAHRRLKKETPTTTFGDIWYLLRPGALSYAKYDDTWLGCVVETATCDEGSNADGTDKKWTIRAWMLDNSWNTARICRATFDIEIEHFEGEKVVTDLPIFPREYFDKTDNGVRKAEFESRGKRCADIVWEGHSYQFYDGRAMTDKKPHLKGPIIAETQEPWWASRDETKWSSMSWAWRDLEQAVVYNSCHLQKNSESLEIKKLEFNADSDSKDDMTTVHHFLLCPVLIGFSLATKAWVPVNIEFMKPVEKPAFTPDANIAEENLNIIKALSYRQTKSKLSWSADFIKNKGDGVVCLLHGPPGVGKTYTVETTAIHTRRPLVALTIGDLGSNESSIEEQLSRWFGLATRWRAVLLIDEADIFLEKRRTSDLARNGVVTAFLRKMEYFGGLLFLTTNRIDTMDEAFMSRVHVVMGFEKLSDDTRVAIWRSFFKKLRDEMEQIKVSDEAEKYVLNNPEIVTMDWNGREIRNAFQTAIALAEYEASERDGYKEEDIITIDAGHFKRVMEISKNFKSYVDKTKAAAREAAAKESGKDSDSNSDWAEFRDE
jgi:NACalpha-BTF3-like transcription factor